jgi:predicted transglutaminase-like cysteine proteinase
MAISSQTRLGWRGAGLEIAMGRGSQGRPNSTRSTALFSPCLCPSLDEFNHFDHSQSAVANMSTTTTVTQAPQITAENILRLFPQINTSLANAVSATQDNDLEGYDEEQIRLMDEVCIVLDENDLPIGSASKKVCTYHS